MKFGFIDRIIELSHRERIVAVKAVSRAEDYLADHFPTFPVLPGVLMLEAMVEAAAWLVRDAQDFSSSIILLQQAKNVTYKSFVRPGELLQLTVNCRKLGQESSEFAGVGHCRNEEVVRARFHLLHTTAQRRWGGPPTLDDDLITGARARFADLRRS